MLKKNHGRMRYARTMPARMPSNRVLDVTQPFRNVFRFYDRNSAGEPPIRLSKAPVTRYRNVIRVALKKFPTNISIRFSRR